NPALGWRELYRRGLVVGRDHIGSLVNTLALAYAGTALPLLLLFSTNNVPFAVALNRELVASEVARTLLGSLGLVAAVPITTALAALAARQPLSGSIGQDRVQVKDEPEGRQIRGN
ncbi:MAG TPA: YibE/F family protein, partial [Chloroflexota bacterium]|nr:YibE/F family protein [Chloroflexota bacterium]